MYEWNESAAPSQQRGSRVAGATVNRDAAIEWARRLNWVHLYAQVAEARETADYWLAEHPNRGYYLRWCGPLPRRSAWDLGTWEPSDSFKKTASKKLARNAD